MKSRRRKEKTILKKLIIPMLFVVTIQSLVFIVTITSLGIINKLEDDAASIFMETVTSRKNTLEFDMIQNWTNVVNFMNISNKYCEDIKNNGVIITEPMVESLLDLLRYSKVTGAFLILNEEAPADNGYDAFYLRDLDPSNTSFDNSDILVEVGSSKIIKEMQLTMDTNWNTKIFLSKDNEADAFFFKPLEKAQNSTYTSLSDFGYWSMPFQLAKDDIEIITYTIPIIDDSGAAYGVVGIDITLDYLRKSLPYQELEKNNGAYFLAVTVDGKSYRNIIEVGPIYSYIVSKTDVFNLERDSLAKDYYHLDSDADSSEIIVATSRLNLYDSNTPFVNQKWMLCGMTKKSILLREADRLKLSLYLSFILTLIIGASGSIILSITFSKPISQLATKLKSSDLENAIKLPRIYTKEIDNLSRTIEMFSEDIVHYASRLSEIFQIVDLPLGTIEYNKITTRAWCTKNVALLLEFPQAYIDQRWFTEEEFTYCASEFIKKAKLISRKVCAHEIRVVEYKNGNKTRWLKIHIVDQEDRILVALIDATEEIEEKIKIEYERDYDILTHLLNRRSFKQKIYDILAGNISGVGAMVMWDLDNLKFINDTYGHDMGDKYIIESANVLSTLSKNGAVVSRRSGDEFLVFIYGYQSQKEILDIIKEKHEKIFNTEFYIPNNNSTKLRASAGIAWFPQNGTDYDTLVRYADFAMYCAKKSVKGSIQEFNTEEFKRDEVLFEGKEELNVFFEHALVKYAFQPIVDVKRAEVFGYEALMRPQGDKLKSVADVMRLSKMQSKLYQMEYLTWMEATNAYISLKRNDEKDTKLFINSVPNTCLSENDLKSFENKYKKYLRNIVIEIIEVEQLDKKYMAEKAAFINRCGLSIALDDFGSGYNSESVLVHTTPNYVKLDMSLIRSIDKDNERQNLIAGMINYIKIRNAKVIAEGVETKEEMQALIKLGVDYAQGYYLGKPEFDLKDIAPEIKEELLMLQNN